MNEEELFCTDDRNKVCSLMPLIGTEDWPQSVVDACRELLQILSMPAGVLDCYKMPGWIN